MFKPAYLVLLFSAPFPALAETREERLALAKEYVELAVPILFSNIDPGPMHEGFVRQAKREGKIISPEEEEQMLQFYRDTYIGIMTELMLAQTPMMAEEMAMAELTALRDFYASPEGSSAAAKLSFISSKHTEQFVSRLSNIWDEMEPKLKKIIGD